MAAVRSPGSETLLERDIEVAAVGALVADARAGDGRMLLLEGEAGIGKTRLLDAAARSAGAAGVHVLSARARPLERTFPFGVARQLLEARVHALAPDVREEVVKGAAAPVAPLVGLSSSGPAADAGPAAAHALYWLVVNLADVEPLLLVIDDLQWADDPSLRWLAHLAVRLDGLRIGIVAAARPGEPGPHEDVLGDLRLEPAVAVLRPEPLSAHAVRELLDDAVGPPEEAFVDGCWRRTGGNPFLLTELVAAVVAEGVRPTGGAVHALEQLRPERVEHEVGRRLATLSEEARDVARAAAVLGDDATADIVAGLVGLAHGAVADAADLLTRLRVLRPGFPLDFVHALVRAAVIATAPAGRMDRLHRDAARLLSSRGGALHRAAGLLLASSPAGEPWAADVLAAAGDDAMQRGDPADAQAYLLRALAEPADPSRRGALLHRLGRAQLALGDPAAVESLQLAQASGSGGAAVELGTALLRTGRVAEAAAAIELALAQADPEDRETRLRLEAERIAMSLLDLSHLGEVAARAAELAKGLAGATEAERLVLANTAVVLAATGEPLASCAEIAEDALAGGLPADTPTYYLVLDLLIDAERYDGVRAALAAAVDDARRRGLMSAYIDAEAFRAYLDWFAGALPDAAAAATAAIDAAREAGAWAPPMALAALSDALVERGELDEAQALYTREGLEAAVGDDALTGFVLFARGRLHLARGDVDAALEDFAEIDRRDEASGRTGVVLLWRSAAALALATRGQRDRAAALAREEVDRAAVGGSRPRGVALCALGVAIGGDDGIAALEEAVALLARSPARLEHARAQVELGAALRRHNRRTDAVEILRDGLDGATRCGALVLAGQARDELHACGVRPRSALRSGAAALTPSERRVALLAADGLGNTEIAQRLFVTRKTVETHLSRAYDKLGIGSRDGLGDALSEGLVDAPADSAGSVDKPPRAG